jgi:hypothetical protein
MYSDEVTWTYNWHIFCDYYQNLVTPRKCLHFSLCHYTFIERISIINIFLDQKVMWQFLEVFV